MKIIKFRKLGKLQKIGLLSTIGVLLVVALGAGVYAIQPKEMPTVQKANANVSDKLDTNKIEEAPKQEAVEDIKPATSAPTPASTTPAPAVNHSVSTPAPEDAELDKNCGLVNNSIDHIRSTYAARGASPSNKDILNDLSTGPRFSAAYNYYGQCVAAGKTQAL